MRKPVQMKPVLMIEEGGRGGVVDYTESLVGAMVELGQPVVLVTASDHLLPELDGVETLGWFHYLRPTSAITRTLRALRLGPLINGCSFLVTYLRCVARARRCRLVHIQAGTSPLMTLLLIAMLRGTGRVVVDTPHNTFPRAGWRERRPGHLVERTSSVTIVHARADLENLTDPDRAVVIPHGEYTTLADGGREVGRDEARAKLGIGPEAPVTLVFGQLRKDKGIIDVLAAALEIPDLVVLIAGESAGGLEAAASLIGAERLRGRVVIREGFQSMDEAAEVFAATDTVALAYRQASASGVLMLAYGFGRPVVIYPTGGLPEAVVDGETGWICERSDPDSLADALRAAAAAGPEECRRRGEAAARLARSDFSWGGIARRTLAVYDEVAPPGPASSTVES
jgi:glycosyltransferase involved in cell wall biosynthesis